MLNKKQKIEKIYFKALDAVKPKALVKNNISIDKENLTVVNETIPLDSFKDLYIFCAGKAAFDTAKECEEILKENIKGGIAVSTKKGKLKYLEHITSTHPKVSKKSLEAADRLIKEASKLKKNDLFLFFLSGGASAMIEKPSDNIKFEDFKTITSSLVKSGIDIKALNKVRKSISAIKGGKLAGSFSSKGYVLVLSDVIGNDIDTIGSAPMNNGVFPHYVIGSNKIALKEAKKYIKNEVQKTKIFTTSLDLSSKEASTLISNMVKKYDKEYDSYCLLLGGETTSKVKGSGIGGRNQELALRLVLKNCIGKDTVILCAGSDGIDGNSDANGAFIDRDIYKKIKEKNLDPRKYLDNSDSCTFFKKLGYGFITGITGTNVMDFVIILKLKG